MKSTEDHSQGYLLNLIDPSFIPDPTMNNGQDLDFPIFPDNMQDLNDFEFSLLSSYGGVGRTGFTPGLDNVPYDFSFQPQNSNNSDIIDLQINPCLAPATTPSTAINPSTLGNAKTYQLETCNSNKEDVSTGDTRKRGRATAEDHQAGTEATHPLPAKKRRNRRPKNLSEHEIQQKREQFLNRNRLAASKCRIKKKESTHMLEDQLRQFQTERKGMEYVICELLAEIDKYTELLQSHAGCDNQAIDFWLAARANAMIPETLPHNERPSVSPSSSAGRGNYSLLFSGEGTRDDSNSYAASQNETMESIQHFPEGASKSLSSFGHSSPTDAWLRMRQDSSVVLLEKTDSSRTMNAPRVYGDNDMQYVDSAHQDSGVSDLGSPD
ncbi:hypothetical protein BP6252_07312 [Coleophoma cylindrospora]|uniref:BZIP domain-containing protein n=1 Tax=Coleophoma cylindrospora TaxID=1849047 RepID=A0A3D8RH76_9HELO|nr:hypothetical protein BP6252_07312 [Coleophoma cylindrospora]